MFVKLVCWQGFVYVLKCNFPLYNNVEILTCNRDCNRWYNLELVEQSTLDCYFLLLREMTYTLPRQYCQSPLFVVLKIKRLDEWLAQTSKKQQSHIYCGNSYSWNYIPIERSRIIFVIKKIIVPIKVKVGEYVIYRVQLRLLRYMHVTTYHSNGITLVGKSIAQKYQFYNNVA